MENKTISQCMHETARQAGYENWDLMPMEKRGQYAVFLANLWAQSQPATPVQEQRVSAVKDQQDLVNQLMNFCIEETKKGNHFFIHYSGHVNTIDIHGYVGEWAIRRDPIESYNFNLSELTQKKVDNCIDTFKLNIYGYQEND